MQGNIKKIIGNEKGLTLVEVMVSILLLSIIAMTFMNVFVTAFDISVKAQDITSYTYATQGVIEELRSYDYGTLIEKVSEIDNDRVPFDTNSDGTDDCFMTFSMIPYGTVDKVADGNPGAFVHILYLVDNVLVIDGAGNTFYTSAKNNHSMALNVQNNGEMCTINVNGVQSMFSREEEDRYVCVLVNLNYKDLGYNNNLVVTGDRSKVLVKEYGNELILNEFTADVTSVEYRGINNLNSALVKINVELFHEEDDDESFFDIVEIVEVQIGDRHSLMP